MSLAGTLEIQHLSKSYPVKNGDLSVLEDVTLTIAPGEFVSIVGSSGCGKSTLLRLVVGLPPLQSDRYETVAPQPSRH